MVAGRSEELESLEKEDGEGSINREYGFH